MIRNLKRAARRNPWLRKAYYKLVGYYHGARLRSARLQLSPPENNNETAIAGGIDPAKIVWIFCTSRSGSTWLRGMLEDLVECRVWEEPKVGLLFGSFYDRAQEGQLGSPNFVMGDPTRKVWMNSLRNFVLDTARAAHPSITAGHYLIVKEPDGAIGAPLLMEALPESRMVLLIRDPRDVTASALDAKRKGNWMYEAQDETLRQKNLVDENPNAFVRSRAVTYRRAISKARQAYYDHRGSKCLVRYEDLRSDTLETMKRLCSALELACPDEELSRTVEKHSWENVPYKEKGAGKFYRKGASGSWGEDLTPRQVKIIEEITAPLLEEFYS